MRWLLLEPYYDGSHRALIEGLVHHVLDAPEVWTLPARKWKWRMRGAALHFARRLGDERPAVDAVFTTSMLDAAALRGLLPRWFADRPLVVYFHENQLAYPIQHFDRRDHHFAWTNVQSALAADLLLFNSQFDLQSMLESLESLLRKMPDARPDWVVEHIRARAQVLPVPIDADAIATDAAGVVRSGPCHILWNHRWEFDKGPDLLLAAVQTLVARGLPFRLSLLGQRFREVPPAFERLQEIAGAHLEPGGYLEDRRAYHRRLATADVALSTARHEFQGLATLEAAAAGAVPLVPDALAYREIWPEQWRYPNADPVGALVDRIERLDAWRATDPRSIARSFDWSVLRPRWRQTLSGARPQEL